MRLALVIVALALGCDSNPTPHPQNDGAVDTRADASPEPGDDKGPDLDGDGVPDCAAAGGFWNGEGCTDQPTGLVDAVGGDASAPTDGVDGELGPDAADDGEVTGDEDAGDEVAPGDAGGG